MLGGIEKTAKMGSHEPQHVLNLCFGSLRKRPWSTHVLDKHGATAENSTSTEYCGLKRFVRRTGIDNSGDLSWVDMGERKCISCYLIVVVWSYFSLTTADRTVTHVGQSTSQYPPTDKIQRGKYASSHLTSINAWIVCMLNRTVCMHHFQTAIWLTYWFNKCKMRGWKKKKLRTSPY